MNFTYDVALSFAGEQRKDVERVAACLKAAGLNVFYDDYEKAGLWGKDLYVHLSDVYQHKARYCIIFSSKEYAEKQWTNHERQNAQARALSEKGNDYILPVRFDDTNIPGILPTIGYLDFRREEADGVCRAFLQKIGAAPPVARAPESIICESSPRGLIQSGALKTIAFPPVVELSWKSDSADLLVEPDDQTDGPFFDRLRGQRDTVIAAYGHNAGVCRIAGVEHIAAAGKQRWRIQLKDLESDFATVMEPDAGGTSADQFAELRARRIFLNGNTPERTTDVNKIMRDIFIRGQGTKIQIEGSILPPLYAEYGKQPDRFLEIAWITAVMQAKLSNTVASVDRLRLTLQGSTLAVEFQGTRARKYVNADPYVIKLNGELDLRS